MSMSPEHTMPGMPASRVSSAASGLVLAPFRGLRYDPARVSSLAAVTSPPYDVVDDEDARTLAAADPHNIIRLILPRALDGDPEDRYEQAARTLRRWVADGTLRRDHEPALYVLEQHAPGLRQRGVIGALELRPVGDRVVLPHEDVMPGPVQDRLRLLRATEANLEPILLLYEGSGGTASQLVDQVARDEEPVLSTTTVDGVVHRLWLLSDRERLAALANDLRPRQALIADGHHRYATYLRFQAEQRRRFGPGPWDRGLCLLVDYDATPPQLTSISRVLPGLSFSEAVRDAEPFVRVTSVPNLADALERLIDPGIDAAASMVVAGDGQQALLFVEGIRAPDSSAADFLHEVLLPRCWHVTDPDTEVAYVHDSRAAIKLAETSGGVAILLRPPTVAQVLQIAGAGQTLPRKATSFGPKPRDGLVLRSFAEN